MTREPLTIDELDRMPAVAPACPACPYRAIISRDANGDRRWTCPTTEEEGQQGVALPEAVECWNWHAFSMDDEDDESEVWSAPVDETAWLFITGAPMLPGFAPKTAGV